MEAIEHIHFACHLLYKQTMGKYLPVAGNVGYFVIMTTSMSSSKAAGRINRFV